ncbi:MAG TPA: hypothetical protein VFP26_07945 [Gemmatimonadaceae bacterium]|nr:hypothetical protein [Gemmatimonadaceae bacterium]
MLERILRWLGDSTGGVDLRQSTLLGIPVVVESTRPDIDSAEVLARIERCLTLIRQYVPHHFRHMQRDFSFIVSKRFACRGAYFHNERACLVELTFCVNPDFSDAEVAATILHEAMHARLDNLGFPLEMEDRARQERFCRRAELEFGALVPGGEKVIERAQQTIELADEEVAPIIDPDVAAERIAAVDRAALGRRT